MQLTLFAPGLLLPGEILSDSVFDLEAPMLSLLLGRGQRHQLDPDWLAGAFGLAAPLPAAVLRKIGAGETADGEWICLDPVNFQVAREGIFLADPAHLDLDGEEADALREAVKPLFTEWGNLSASGPRHWELRLSRSLLLETQPLPDVIGLPVDPAMPAGLDGKAWRSLLAEAQTILHAHKINRQREARDKPAINSLWPWGQGSLPERSKEKPRTDFDVVWSADPLIAGLCAHAGIPCIAPPARFQPASGAVLCHVSHLTQPAQAYNALTWRLALLSFERDWLAPAIAALKNGECEALRLVGTSVHGTPKCVVFSLVRGNLWRFWRRPLPLTALA